MIDRLAWEPILYFTHLHNNKVYLPADMGTVDVDPREVLVDEGAPGSTDMALHGHFGLDNCSDSVQNCLQSQWTTSTWARCTSS